MPFIRSTNTMQATDGPFGRHGREQRPQRDWRQGLARPQIAFGQLIRTGLEFRRKFFIASTLVVAPHFV